MTTDFPAPGVPLDLTPTAEDYAEAGEPIPVEGVRPGTPLSNILGRIRRNPSAGEAGPWAVRTQPGFALCFTLGVDPDEVQAYAEATVPKAKRKNYSGRDVNETEWYARVLGRYNTKILLDGAEWRDDRGDLVTFGSDEFRKFHDGQVFERVMAFFGKEGKGDILRMGRRLVEDSGVGSDQPEEESQMDPTSSTS